MRTTIELARKRLEVAETTERDLRGESRDGMLVSNVGEWTLVNDGQDCWFTTTVDYENAIDEIVGRFLDGVYDRAVIGDDEDDGVSDVPYGDFIDLAGCLYSSIGMPSDESVVHELDCDDETRETIAEHCGIDMKQTV